MEQAEQLLKDTLDRLNRAGFIIRVAAPFFSDTGFPVDSTGVSVERNAHMSDKQCEPLRIEPGDRYQDLAARTEAPITPELLERLTVAVRLVHGILGLATEVGEAADQLKRHVFYGAEFDDVNLDEEMGDLMWYVALLCNVNTRDLAECQRRNIAKLRKRFPDKFNETDAVERDLSAERSALEE